MAPTSYFKGKRWITLTRLEFTFITLNSRSTDESVGSKERRGKYGRIPDLSLLVQYDSHTALPFVCEVKSPSHMQNLSSTTDVQNPDFIKLANIMKDELDHMHFIEDKVIYGLLIEGIYEIRMCLRSTYVNFYCFWFRFQMPVVCYGPLILQTLPPYYVGAILLATRFVWHSRSYTLPP